MSSKTFALPIYCLSHSLLQEDVPEFVEDDEIEESDISDMEVISEHIFSNAILLILIFSSGAIVTELVSYRLGEKFL